jgi:lysophospholipase L1-like esterase
MAADLNHLEGQYAQAVIDSGARLSRRAITLGDSRMGRDGSVVAPATPGESAIYTSDRGILSWANTILRKRLDFVKNGGIGGDTVAQMLARLPALLSTYSPSWVIGLGHINSVSADVTAAAIIADLSSIFNMVEATGARISWGTDWASSVATTPQRAVLYAVNEWLRGQAMARPGFVFVDYQAVFADPTTGNPASGYASDGLHQDSAGAIVLGGKLAEALLPYLSRTDRLVASNDDPTNLISNGMMVGNSGGISTSWGPATSVLTGTPTKVARTDGFPGEWQQVVVAGASGFYFFRFIVNIGATLAVGDNIFFECEFETDAGGWTAYKFFAQIQAFGSFPGGTVTQVIDMAHPTGSANAAVRTPAGIFRTPVLTVPATTTSVQVGVMVEGGAGTFRMARARLVKVT